MISNSGKIKNPMKSKKYNNTFQIDTGSDRNVMGVHKFKIYFLG